MGKGYSLSRSCGRGDVEQRQGPSLGVCAELDQSRACPPPVFSKPQLQVRTKRLMLFDYLRPVSGKGCAFVFPSDDLCSEYRCRKFGFKYLQTHGINSEHNITNLLPAVGPY